MSIPSVSFRGAEAAAPVNDTTEVKDTATTQTPAADPFARPGAYSGPATDEVVIDGKPKKSKMKTALKVGGTLVAVAAVLGALKKFDIVKVLTEAEKADAGIFKKAQHYVAKAGEFINKYTIDLLPFGKKKGAEIIEEEVEEVTGAGA